MFPGDVLLLHISPNRANIECSLITKEQSLILGSIGGTERYRNLRIGYLLEMAYTNQHISFSVSRPFFELENTCSEHE